MSKTKEAKTLPSLEEMPTMPTPTGVEEYGVVSVRDDMKDNGPDLEAWGVPDWVAERVRDGFGPNAVAERSKRDYFLACEMLRRGVTPEQVLEAATTEGWDFCYDGTKRREEPYIKKLIKSASGSVARELREIKQPERRMLGEVWDFVTEYRTNNPDISSVKASVLYREYLLWEQRMEDMPVQKFGALVTKSGIGKIRRSDGVYRVLRDRNGKKEAAI